MALKDILTVQQSKFLDFFATKKGMRESFYFTGGTALAEYYLHHRISEDLDFFNKNEFSSGDILPFIKDSKKELGFNKFEFQHIFNRSMYFLDFGNKGIMKVEFTYFPFESVDSFLVVNQINVDSLLDIAVNKLFTIYQQPRGRDYVDLFLIIQSEPRWNLSKLKKLARIKFDTTIDPLMLGKQLIKVSEMKDDPILIRQKLNLTKVENWFIKQARELGKEILM